MQKIHCSIIIDAPKEKVWDTMLNDATYREWTSVFAEGSHYEGDWTEDSKMVFLDPKEENGMLSVVAESRPYEFLSLKHIGIIRGGVEDTKSEEVQKWAGALENYTLKEADGGTEVVVDMDIEDEYKDMFDKLWPEALQKLKVVAER